MARTQTVKWFRCVQCGQEPRDPMDFRQTCTKTTVKLYCKGCMWVPPVRRMT